MIKQTEVKVFKEKLICDDCGEEMKSTGVVLMTYPVQYPHVCLCGKKTTLSEKYPRIAYEEIAAK